MTDKLPPAHLRDLAELIWRNTTVGDLLELSRAIEKEAARREAEAKTHVCEFLPGLDGVDACHGCGRKLLPKELGQTRSGEARDTATPLHLPPQVEREGLDSADAELVKRLKDRARLWSKDLPGNVAPEQSIWWEAADRIEAQAREIADAQRAALSAQDSAITANARWNDSFRAAEQFKSERDTLKARVAELEADMKHMWPAADDAQSVFIDGHGFVSLDYDDARLKRAEQAEAKAARLVQSLGAISLFGITGDQFVSQGPGLALKRLREAVACAERALAGQAMPGSDELYTVDWSGRTGDPTYAGFNRSHVLDLVRAAFERDKARTTGSPAQEVALADTLREALTPFAALLKENKDAS